ncbi:MAG: phospholipase/lecithinase/hemolysin [Gammaproteobacteria bacterium]|jgi:phospholipase/lecithinase/hemolysin
MQKLLRMILITAAIWAGPANAAFTNLSILGDSLSDTGNLAGALYQATLGLVSIPGPPYAGGRFSNGPIWVDYFKAMRPGVAITNYAVGGAFTGNINGRDNAGDDELAAIPIFGGSLAAAATGLNSQLAAVPVVSGNDTAFLLWIGANDINTATDLGFTKPQDVVPIALGNVINTLGTLLFGRGATQIYVVNLPDLGRTPRGLTSGIANDLSQATMAFNSILMEIANNVGPQITLIDAASPFNYIQNHPELLGFTDISTPCVDGIFDSSACSNPSEHLFWDTVHPTTKAHMFVAGALASALDGTPLGTGTFAAASVVPLPPAWVLLGSCLFAARLRRYTPTWSRPSFNR